MLEAKLQVRRRMAKASFCALLVTLAALLAALFLGGPDTVAILNAATGIMCMVLGCLTAIVTAYMGITAHSDHEDKKRVVER